MLKKYDLVVFVGRCEPLHNGHISTFVEASTRSDNLLILFGSSNQPPTIKNPWSFQQRLEMLNGWVATQPFKSNIQVGCQPIVDIPYNDTLWCSQVQETVAKHIAHWDIQHPKIALIGHSKDETSYYLRMFPQWDQIETPHVDLINATDLRHLYFSGHSMAFLRSVVPTSVYDFLHQFRKTPQYTDLQAEYVHIQKYKAAWAAAPYPPTFVTVDAVVIQSGHVLLVERKHQPGKGLLALPGGFVNQNETLLTATIRELREETKLKVAESILKRSLVTTRVFDKPDRSLRGRTITQAYLFDITPDKVPSELPHVKGTDDAKRAFWLPIADVREDQMFEDHYSIIHQLIGTL